MDTLILLSMWRMTTSLVDNFNSTGFNLKFPVIHILLRPMSEEFTSILGASYIASYFYYEGEVCR